MWVEQSLDKTKYDYEIVFTQYAGHATELATQAVSAQIPIVAAVGGDGTINEIGKTLIDTDVCLAIVPFGSGNGLARSLKMPLHPQKIISQIINVGNHKLIDTATVNGIPFLSVAGFGLDAQTADDFAKNPRRGFVTYAYCAAHNFFHMKLQTCTVQLDNHEPFDVKPLMVTFANSNQFGYDALIAPHAKLDDGLLDVCFMDKPFLAEVPLMLAEFMHGKIDHSHNVTIKQARKILIHRKQNAVVNIDGESFMMDKDLLVEVKPQSLNLLF